VKIEFSKENRQKGEERGFKNKQRLKEATKFVIQFKNFTASFSTTMLKILCSFLLQNIQP
jgi:hypothetical protein